MSDPAQEDLSGSEGDQMGSSPPSKCSIVLSQISIQEIQSKLVCGECKLVCLDPN